MRSISYLTFALLLSYFQLQSWAEDAKTEEPKTRVRLVGAPIGTFETRSYTTLTKISVTAQNSGGADAINIQIYAITPNGNSVRLSGPDTLKKYEKGHYTSSVYETIATTKKIRATVSCDNCIK